MLAIQTTDDDYTTSSDNLTFKDDDEYRPVTCIDCLRRLPLRLAIWLPYNERYGHNGYICGECFYERTNHAR